jgi:hypothetical protein
LPYVGIGGLNKSLGSVVRMRRHKKLTKKTYYR